MAASRPVGNDANRLPSGTHFLFHAFVFDVDSLADARDGHYGPHHLHPQTVSFGQQTVTSPNAASECQILTFAILCLFDVL